MKLLEALELAARLVTEEREEWERKGDEERARRAQAIYSGIVFAIMLQKIQESRNLLRK